MPDKDAVIEVLKKVEDPELHLDIWTLGLVYNVDLDKDKVHIKMTFTTPFCPYGPYLLQEVQKKVEEIEGVSEAKVELVLEPPWEPSEEVKSMLGV